MNTIGFPLLRLPRFESLSKKDYLRPQAFTQMKQFLFLFALISFNSGIYSQTDYPLETVLQKGHTDYIKCYDFSADGTFLVTGGFDNVLILWDIQSGKQIRTFSGHTKRIRSVKFSPDQLTLLSVSADNSLKVFEVITGRLIHSITVPDHEFYSAYYSPQGNLIYALDNRDGIFVWDAKTGNELGQFVKEYGANNENAIIHPNDNRILSLDGDKGSLVLDIKSKDTLLVLPFDKAHSQSFSPDGELIAISSRKLFASVFNAKSGKLVYEFKDGEQLCDGCNTKHVFSPDSKYLVTMSNKVGAILWDLSTGKKVRTFFESDDRPEQLLFSPKGSYLLISLDDEVHVFDTKSGKEKLSAKSDQIEYLEFAFSPDESIIILPNLDSGIEVWSVQRGKSIKTIAGYLNHPRNSGLDLSYSNWIDQSILNAIQAKRKVLLSPDNQYVLIAGIDTCAQLIDLKQGRVVKTFQGHSKSVIAFDFSADGKFIATGGGDRLINIWEVASGKLIKTLRGHQETIFDLKFSADGTEILSGSWDGSMRLWNIESGKYRYIEMNNNSPYNVGFTPDELYLISGNLDHQLQFWEKDAAEPFRTLIGFTSVPSGFDFSPDRQTLVTSSWDGKVKVWNVLTGMLLAKMEQHQGRVYGVKFDPKGRFIASCGADNKIILWSPQSNKIVSVLTGHANSVTSLDITDDGKFLVSISVDGVVKLWDLSTFKEIYSRVQLSRNEWLATTTNGYFDGSPKALDWVNYVKGNQVVNVNNLFEKYYSPGLILRVQENDPSLNNRGEVLDNELNRLPDFTLAVGAGSKRSVMDQDSVFKANSAQLPLEITIAPHIAPLDEIRVYNNGKLVVQERLDEAITFRGADRFKRLINVDLSNGLNELSVILINHERTSSSPTKVLVEYDGVAAQVDLYIMTIGINNYKNPTYKLDYAVNDANAFLAAIKNGTDSLFNQVKTYSILNEAATKSNILATIQKIKEEIGPEDVFLFYYAGHGVMSNPIPPEVAEFFIVTHDVTNLYDATSVLREKALSAAELMQISMEITAEKQLFILDACHSGGAIESFALRGSEREKALAQLARNTGTFFLTASQDAEFANEVGQLNHGLFTYALLELLQGTVVLEGDQRITVSELKAYVEERVPELSQVYQGSPQYPTGYSFGRDFPIVILK